ncbi:hypothetical protein [Agromyces laixinhei]|uniref:hypothetical protein n=1 Tax=Agromyces laixinhei TaxID=2585717 RepID=UPI0012EDB7C3|nr:hypothetical protein [Agromyces laixinhei]
MSFLPDDVVAFIDATAALRTETLADLRRTIALASEPAARAPKLDAAQFDALAKHLRDAFRPRADELAALVPNGALSASIANTSVVAQAIWKRAQLTDAEFQSLTGAYRDVGLEF